MTTWRMSFRVGNRGYKMWPDCFRLGVAAITYSPLAMTDLSKYPEGEPRARWAKLAPSQKASLHRVVYEMKRGDVIYVKEGQEIVSKGVVKGPYQFDSKFGLRDPGGVPWSHQVPVDWVPDFPRTRALVGRSQQLTVEKLSTDDLKRLGAMVTRATESDRRVEAIEGEAYKKETVFRRRNRALIQAKKANSDYRCEVCRFSFQETYPNLGHEYIVAHHLKPIAVGRSRTTLDDIALVCANCHAMLHTKQVPIPIRELRMLISNHARGKKALRGARGLT